MISERNKYLLAVLGFLVLAGTTSYYISYSPALNILTLPSITTTEELPDTYLNHANITSFNAKGEPKFRMTSAQITHYPGEKDAEVIKPLVFIFQEQGSPWKIQAQKGWVTPDGERVQLENNVIISRQASAQNTYSQLESEQLYVWPKREYAESEKAVTITTKDTIINAIGFEADLHEQQYHLLSQVKVKHLVGK